LITGEAAIHQSIFGCFVHLQHHDNYMLAILCHLFLDLDKKCNVIGMLTLHNLAIAGEGQG
jgi:hypothetical protein